MKSFIPLVILIFFTSHVYADNIKNYSDWKAVEGEGYLFAVADGASVTTKSDGTLSLDNSNLARLSVICQKKERIITTIIVPSRVTPAGKIGESTNLSYTMAYGGKPQHKIAHDWKKIVYDNKQASLQTISPKYPTEILNADKGYYLLIFDIEENDQPISFAFSLNGYSEAVEHVINACDDSNDNLKNNYKESQVFYATEINNNLIGHDITAEGAERYAIFAEDAFKQRMRNKYKEAGFSLENLPSVSHKVLLLEASGKTIGCIVYEYTGETTEGSKTSYFIHIIGIDNNKMHKVICEGVKNFVDDK